MSPIDPAVFRDCKPSNYWLDGVERPSPTNTPLPAAVDLLIVGSGYTGLAAAAEAAAGGMSVLVLDRECLGHGCSTRNGGQVSSSIKPSFAELTARHGAELAARIRADGRNALAHVEALAAAGAFRWQKNGRLLGAHSARKFEALRRSAEHPAPGEPGAVVIEPSRMREELASDRYHGGIVQPGFGMLDPARFHDHLLTRARDAGAIVVGHAEVRSLVRDGTGFEADTAQGHVRARNVLIATNGYTGALSPWHRRRVIPIGSYMLATEPLGTARVAGLIPHDRTVVDTRRVVIYFRSSPDRQRILFGGRAALFEADPLRALPRLYALMLDVFPQLAGTRVTHTWMGFVAYTFDTLPHIGTHEGVHYAMGYCGSGVSLASYFGMRAGQQILGRPEGKTALDGLPFSTRPFYRGTPWFLAPTVLTYRLLDRYLS